MQSLYSLLFIAYVPFAIPLSHTEPDKSKYIEKTFALAGNGTLEIANSFGDVNIKTWDRESVYFKITVTVTGSSDVNLQKRLEDVDVRFTASPGEVSARTLIDEQNAMWSWLKGKNRTNLKIDYEVTMPVTATLDVRNDYGTVTLDKLQGALKLRCDFGRIAIGQLLHEANELSFDYTKNSHIDYMRAGTIKADFSEMRVYGAERVKLAGDYSSFHFKNLKDINFNTDFSTVVVDKALHVQGRGDYATLELGNIAKTVDLNTDFGKVTIATLENGFNKATLRTEYTNVTVGYESTTAFNFDARVEYATLKLSDKLTITRSEKDEEQKIKSGYNAVASSPSTIEMRCNFGTITLREK